MLMKWVQIELQEYYEVYPGRKFVGRELGIIRLRSATRLS